MKRIALFLFLISGLQAAENPKTSPHEDPLRASILIDPKLSSAFFKSIRTSYPWHIASHPDGSLEDTMDGSINREDLLQTEQTANCRSSHQGDHQMSFCEAFAGEDGIRLEIFGGMPAYTGALTVRISNDRSFLCSFDAVYPNLNGPLHWKIKSKKLLLKSFPIKAGERIWGWLSVEFEESDSSNPAGKKYKIEGFLKPVLMSASKASSS